MRTELGDFSMAALEVEASSRLCGMESICNLVYSLHHWEKFSTYLLMLVRIATPSTEFMLTIPAYKMQTTSPYNGVTYFTLRAIWKNG